jgi:predicted permease
MSLLYVLLAIIVVGVLLYLFNTYVTAIDPKFKQLVNIVAIVGTIIWLLYVFGIWQKMSGVTVHQL